MADKEKKDGRVGAFRLGRQCDEVGPELGRLYESRRVDTGKPALTMLPGDRVVWQPEGAWKVRLSCQPKPPAISLEVDQAPASVSVTELVDILVLMTAAFKRVEDAPKVQAHLAGGPEGGSWGRWTPRVIAGLSVLALGLGTWLHFADGTGHPERIAAVRVAQTDAADLVDADAAREVGVAYPMPAEPFRNQAKAPCKTRLLEVEINGGCWVELAQRPPCAENRAEYDGKCYLPVSKDRGGLPQSVQP